MDLHRKILGWIYAVSGTIGILMTLGITLPYYFQEGPLVIGGIDAKLLQDYALLIVSVLFIASLLSLIAGIGLLQQRGWARSLSIMVGVLSLVDFPIGTTLGVYAIWVLWKNEK